MRLPFPLNRTVSAATRRAPLALLALLMTTLLLGCATTTASQPRTPPPASASHEPQTMTYVALGASDAFGIGTDDPQHDNWPTVLAGLLGSNVHLVNLGIPGTTAKQAIQSELPVAVDAKPDIVTVWLTVNDFLDGVPLNDYAAQLTTLLATLRQQTHARVFVANLPNLALLPQLVEVNAASLDAQISSWNRAIASVVRDQGAVLIDLYAGWHELENNPEYISSDGFHPSTEGARRLAQIFAEAIGPSAPRQ